MMMKNPQALDDIENLKHKSAHDLSKKKNPHTQKQNKTSKKLEKKKKRNFKFQNESIFSELMKASELQGKGRGRRRVKKC